MSDVVLTGLDGKNPLAFLAALGVLDVATRFVRGAAPPKLAWRRAGTHRPIIIDVPDRSALLDLLQRDLELHRKEPAIELLRYQKAGGGTAHDLKPPAGFYGGNYLQALVELGDTHSLALAAAFATDVAVDNNGNTKPTALHFTAGQQEFLTMVSELAEKVSRDDLEEALFGPWAYASSLPVLQWDNATSRDYALRASDPSKDKKLGVPGADWLAFRGLPFIKVAPVGARIATTGCRGEWKTGAFRWPLWSAALDAATIGSLLTSEEIFSVDPQVLGRRGIDLVLEASIRRSDQGGYGSFTPARVAGPER